MAQEDSGRTNAINHHHVKQTKNADKGYYLSIYLSFPNGKTHKQQFKWKKDWKNEKKLKPVYKNDCKYVEIVEIFPSLAAFPLKDTAQRSYLSRGEAT